VQGGQGAGLAPKPMSAVDSPLNEARKRLQGTVTWHRWHRAQCEYDAGAAIALERAGQLRPRPLATFVQIGGPPRRRAVCELHIVVSNRGSAVTQPSEIVVKHAPRSQREPYAQSRDGNAKLVHLFDFSARGDCRQMARQVRQPRLRRNHHGLVVTSGSCAPRRHGRRELPADESSAQERS
jgi:hypothetical protein